MPILGSEPSRFPINLFDPEIQDDSESRWWAILTKTRQEKALGRQLLAQKIAFFLPLVEKDRLIRGRRVRSFLPVFNGYVFLFGTAEERVDALRTNRISQVLEVPDQNQLCVDLQQLSRLIETRAPVTVERRFEPGRRVRIKSGAMAGLEGTVIARRGSYRLLIAVNFLQSGISVEIDDFMVEPDYGRCIEDADHTTR